MNTRAFGPAPQSSNPISPERLERILRKQVRFEKELERQASSESDMPGDTSHVSQADLSRASTHASHQAREDDDASSSSSRQQVPMSQEDFQTMLANALAEQRQYYEQREAERDSRREEAEAKEQSRREAIANMNASSRVSRKNQFVAGGMSLAEAEVTIQEMDARSLGASNQIAVLPQPDRRETIKADRITDFNGDPDDLFQWLRWVESLHNSKMSPQWQDAVVSTLPQCMAGAAKDWYANLSDEARAKLTTWKRWKHALSNIFAPDISELRVKADARLWEVPYETATSYHFEKLNLLKQAYGQRSEEDLVKELKRGLPVNIRRTIRTDMGSGDTDAFLHELRSQEGPYRLEDPKNRALRPRPKGKETATSSVPSRQAGDYASSASSSRQAAGPSSQREERPRMDEMPYVKSNAWTDPKTGGRHYLVPGSKVVLNLKDRKCKHCGGNHFDFEHKHLVKKEAFGFDADSLDHLTLSEDHRIGTVAGYDAYALEGVITIDDEMDVSPSHSPTLTASSSNSTTRLSDASTSPTASPQSGKGGPALA